MTSPVSSVGTSPASASSSSAATSIGGLTMNDFLTLMTAQLQNQDPLNPTDANQFLNQLSELSTVEGISQLNTSLSTLSNSVLSSQAVSSASLVGQTILAPASAASLTSGGALSGAVQVPDGASAVTLTVTDAAGNVVDKQALPSSPGLQTFSWDGKSSNGSPAPGGVYSVAASAVVSGAPQAATTYLNATVSSVTLGSSGTATTLNTSQLGSVPLNSVQQID